MYNVSSPNNDPAARPENHAPRTPSAGAPRGPQGSQQVFRVRYGRTALALTGALALAAVILGLPLAALGAASWWMPLVGVVLAGASVATLRALAVRDRRLRIDAAFRAAMSTGSRNHTVPAPQPEVEEYREVAAEPVRVQRETVLFDAESTQGAPSGSAQADVAAAPASSSTAPASSARPLTAAELRTAALEFAAASTPQTPAGPPKTSTTPWEPIPVPKPIYVEAPVAQRPAPEPLDPPQTPKPEGRTSLRAGAAAPASPAAASSASAGSDAAPGTGKINLDDVLQRRRA